MSREAAAEPIRRPDERIASPTCKRHVRAEGSSAGVPCFSTNVMAELNASPPHAVDLCRRLARGDLGGRRDGRSELGTAKRVSPAGRRSTVTERTRRPVRRGLLRLDASVRASRIDRRALRGLPSRISRDQQCAREAQPGASAFRQRPPRLTLVFGPADRAPTVHLLVEGAGARPAFETTVVTLSRRAPRAARHDPGRQTRAPRDARRCCRQHARRSPLPSRRGAVRFEACLVYRAGRVRRSIAAICASSRRRRRESAGAAARSGRTAIWDRRTHAHTRSADERAPSALRPLKRARAPSSDRAWSGLAMICAGSRAPRPTSKLRAFWTRPEARASHHARPRRSYAVARPRRAEGADDSTRKTDRAGDSCLRLASARGRKRIVLMPGGSTSAAALHPTEPRRRNSSRRALPLGA